MASRILPFRITVPAGTPDTAPHVQDIDLDGWIVQRLDLDVPAGPAGLMGFQVFNNGVPWLPYGADEWVIWDDVKDTWYLDGQPNAGGWEVRAYNTGTYDHSLTVRAHVEPVNAGQSTATAAGPVFVTTAAPANQVVTL